MTEITQEYAWEFTKEKEASLWILLFSPCGRIPRRVYWGFHLVSYTVLIAGSLLLDAVSVQSDTVDVIAMVFFVPLIIAWVFSAICIRIKRFHDMDCNGFYCLWLFVPIATLLAQLFLYFSRGTKGSNRFGPDPTFFK